MLQMTRLAMDNLLRLFVQPGELQAWRPGRRPAATSRAGRHSTLDMRYDCFTVLIKKSFVG